MKSEKTLIKKLASLQVEKKEIERTFNITCFPLGDSTAILTAQRIASLDGQIAILKWILK